MEFLKIIEKEILKAEDFRKNINFLSDISINFKQYLKNLRQKILFKIPTSYRKR